VTFTSPRSYTCSYWTASLPRSSAFFCAGMVIPPGYGQSPIPQFSPFAAATHDITAFWPHAHTPHTPHIYTLFLCTFAAISCAACHALCARAASTFVMTVLISVGVDAVVGHHGLDAFAHVLHNIFTSDALIPPLVDRLPFATAPALLPTQHLLNMQNIAAHLPAAPAAAAI